MATELRKSGIDVLGDVPWGTHLCQFYETPQDLADVLIPYFKAGLEHNEFCMWICSELLDANQARKALKAAFPRLDTYLEKGQIEILAHEAWYLPNGAFDSQRVLDGWIEKMNSALGAGYDGLRMAGNTHWIEKAQWDSFAAYENQVNGAIRHHRMLAVCSYALEKCGVAEILDVTINHQFALLRRHGKWQVIENSERRRAEEALEEANRRLEELATTDDLTGLANRRGFMEAIGLETERARRYGSDFALAMIDVDGFKAINDACGHVFGDRVLVEVARALEEGTRATDLVARYGGDEIMILMPNTDAQAAVSAVERIRHRIAGRVISDGQRSLEVTVSAGVSALDSKDRTAGPDLLICQADEAFYAAKHDGGNVTKTWNEITEDRTGEIPDEAGRVENLQREVAGLSLQAKEMVVQSLWGLVHALEARDAYTKAHSANVTRYAVAIAETLELGPDETGVIRRAAMIHDLGKIAVPDGILRKRGALDDHERRILQGHVLAGVKIIDQMHFLERETPVVRHHHEHWEGGGYPDGIAGEAVPLGARILAVADAFDAITSDRVYRNARSVSDALRILVEESGRQFAPGVVDAMVKWVRATGRELGKDGDLAVADLLSPAPAEAAPVAP